MTQHHRQQNTLVPWRFRVNRSPKPGDRRAGATAESPSCGANAHRVDRQRRNDDGHEPDYRFTLANERTFLAWLRTALALVAGGVAIGQLLPPLVVSSVSHGLATLVIAAGAALAAASVRRWRTVQQAMRHDEDIPHTRLPVVLTTFLLAVCCAMVLLMVGAGWSRGPS
ncbi:YidH family protein [Mycolicibacterium mucogenicum]|uniref:YidH family protein n=1 Tax=Mycolicibacterium mucogenicum TaxID=56689 RepID=UPI002B40BC0E|nr:DUF202 domain-containing protein [Mycolicibacterium mucogenicum]